jgi:hypothetical protein
MKDPTAEFLAQEKEAFSELGDETVLNLSLYYNKKV